MAKEKQEKFVNYYGAFNNASTKRFCLLLTDSDYILLEIKL
jgi:hypothetical protein